MQEQGLDQFNFQGNPFMSMLGHQGSGQSQQHQETGETPMQEGMEPASVKGQAEQAEQNQLMAGQNPGKTRLLMGAVQSLEKFITESDDRDSIMLARGIISAVSKLIERDQERMSAELGE